MKSFVGYQESCEMDIIFLCRRYELNEYHFKE